MKKSNKNNMYGEYVPTEFKWITLDKQKKIANKLADISDKKNNKNIEKED